MKACSKLRDLCGKSEGGGVFGTGECIDCFSALASPGPGGGSDLQVGVALDGSAGRAGLPVKGEGRTNRAGRLRKLLRLGRTHPTSIRQLAAKYRVVQVVLRLWRGVQHGLV